MKLPRIRCSAVRSKLCCSQPRFVLGIGVDSAWAGSTEVRLYLVWWQIAFWIGEDWE